MVAADTAVLLQQSGSSREAHLERRRALLPFGLLPVRRAALARVRGAYLVVEEEARRGASKVQPPRAGALASGALLVNLDGAVVREQRERALVVAYVEGKREKQVVLACASAAERDAWVLELRRASCQASAAVALSRASLDERFVLGRGHFGRVVLATHRESGLVLAVKEMREERAGAGKARRGARGGEDNVQLLKQVGERLLLATLGDNAWVSRLALAFRERGRLYLGFELSARGDLWTLLRAKKRLALPSARFLVAEVSAALASVHALGVVHRDIKLENITLDHGGHVKLIDFGLAKQLARRAPKSADEPPRFGFTFTHVGTSYYFSPEMVSGAGHSLATDWWQVGCLLYELVVGRPAFFDRDPKAVEAKIASRQGPDMAAFDAALDSSSSSSSSAAAAATTISTNTSAEERAAATAMVRALLTHEAGDRLGASSAQQVLTHAFFRGLDMAAVQQRTETPPSEIQAYVTLPGAQDQRAVTRDVVATYFRDAKTLENEPLNKSPASTQGSTSTVLEERTAAMKPSSDGSARGSARTQGSSKSSVTACSECMEQAEAASHMAPREPARQEEIGPFAGFAYINDKLVHALAKDLFAA